MNKESLNKLCSFGGCAEVEPGVTTVDVKDTKKAEPGRTEGARTHTAEDWTLKTKALIAGELSVNAFLPRGMTRAEKVAFRNYVVAGEFDVTNNGGEVIFANGAPDKSRIARTNIPPQPRA